MYHVFAWSVKISFNIVCISEALLCMSLMSKRYIHKKLIYIKPLFTVFILNKQCKPRSECSWKSSLSRILLLCWCFTALRHVSGHFRHGQLTCPQCSWASLLGSLPVLSAHSFASNWQLPFLNQRKRENGRRFFFMTKSPRKYQWKEENGQGLHCLPFLLHHLDPLLYAKTPDYTPGIYAEGSIVFVFPFVCLFVIPLH